MGQFLRPGDTLQATIREARASSVPESFIPFNPSARFENSERWRTSPGVQAIAGGSLTRSKAPGRWFGEAEGPLYVSEGRGAIVFDVDGHSYIDMLCSLGAITLGHDPGRSDGYPQLLSLPHPVEGRAAGMVLQQIAPWAKSVRFVKTGSEATHAAYRIAKRATGRKHVLIGDWAYHGWHEWCEKNVDGRPELETTHLIRHGVMMHAQRCWESEMFRPDQVAAVFIEPHRWEPVNIFWLRDLREWCTKHGILLVFDEMIYGGRWAMGGATEYYGVTPDLACFGKAYGNGAPIAFVVGCEAVGEHGQIVSGTYSGEIHALAQLLRVLEIYKEESVIDTLWARGRQLQRGLKLLVSETGPIRALEGAPVHQRLIYQDLATAHRFSAEMAKRDVLWFHACTNISASHSASQIEHVIEAAHASLRAIELDVAATEAVDRLTDPHG